MKHNNKTTILTEDENYVRIFAEGIKIDETLPKYTIMEEEKSKNVDDNTLIEKVSNLNSFSFASSDTGLGENDFSSLKELNYETLKKYFVEKLPKTNNGNPITDFNLTMSSKMRDIVKKTSFSNGHTAFGRSFAFSENPLPINPSLWETIKQYFHKKKINKIEKEVTDKFDVVKFFADVHIESEKAAQTYVDRITEYVNCIGMTEKTGQLALKEKLFSELIINKYESILFANGYDKLITEETLVKLVKNAPKALTLNYIQNLTRIIPSNIIAKKIELDNLEVFDNYVVLSYDPDGKSYAKTVEERKKEVEKAKDPILFGVISGSNKLYYIDDWVDDYCDLRFENVVEIIGKDEMIKDYLK